METSCSILEAERVDYYYWSINLFPVRSVSVTTERMNLVICHDGTILRIAIVVVVSVQYIYLASKKRLVHI